MRTGERRRGYNIVGPVGAWAAEDEDNKQTDVAMRDLLRWLLLLSGVLCISSQKIGVNRLVCGRRKVKSVYLIHNGIDARPGHWPWHAVIYQRANGAEEYKCGGSIIDEDTILTSGHCVTVGSRAISPEQLSIEVGRIRLHERTEYTQTHGVRQVIAHPD
uniref:Peptidase S1 domain-containing protein n=1 Tax=Anopheles coluzzii TaxID=1518534 RepID=A0A8W7P5M4_ANOCL